MTQSLTAQQIVDQVVGCLRARPVPIGISNRHVHLSEQDFCTLFPGQSITLAKPLTQPGHFAATQTVTLIGPKGKIENVRILGPLRPYSQVEVSATQAYQLGVKAPIRQSGDLKGTPGITLKSEAAEISLTQGVIIAKRHIHMSDTDALCFGLQDNQEVQVMVGQAPRRLQFNDVTVRVDPSLVLEMHLDTDEANAAGLTGAGDVASILFQE